MPTSTVFTGSSLLEDEGVVLKDYLIGHRLGEGAYGSVYSATYAPSGEKFALKILQKSYFLGFEEQIIQEATVMQSIEHSHVVKLYKFLQSTSAFYFLLELAEGGELFDLIISERFFCESAARRYFQQLIAAIDYCHSHGVAHRDLKAENLLLGKNNKLLVCDFGFSSKSNPDIEPTTEDNNGADMHLPIGTLHYTSPEMFSGVSGDSSIDIFQQDLWSAGVILFFMLTGRLPFDGRDDEETIHFIQNGQFFFDEDETQRISNSAKELVMHMLALEPNERLTITHIIEDAWFEENLDSELFPHRTTIKNCTFLNFSMQHRVTREEEDVLEAAFRKIDIDGYGKITRDQIRDMLSTLHGTLVNSEDVNELIALITGNSKSTCITYEQFRDAWVRKDLAHCEFKCQNEFQLNKIIGTHLDDVERKLVRQLRTAFDSVDDHHTGSITVSTWQRLFKRCKIRVSDDEIQGLMRFFDEQDLHSDGEITFDKFLLGIVKREMLVRHPMGRKLAAATNLASLLQSRKVTDCVRHGFFVVGLQRVVLEKLANCPKRLLLMYSDDIVSDTENIYSFRYLGSSALIAGTTMESTAPLLLSQSSTAPLGSSAAGDHIRSPTPSRAFPFVRSLSTSLRSGAAGPLSQLNGSTQAASALTHRALAFGGTGAVGQVHGVCDVDVILSPACMGYTLVRFRRIHGSTTGFHEAVAYITSLLDSERQQAMEDTLPRGESELM